MNTTATKYRISTLTAEQAKTTVDLFVKSFCESEPITKQLNFTHDEYRPFAEEVVKKAVLDGLSVVALDDTGRAVAATIAEDIANPFVPNLSLYPKMQPIVALLEELSKPFLASKVFSKGKIAHVWIAIVAKDCRGNGLSTQIDMACAELLVRKGFNFVYAEFTNDISEKITGHYQVSQRCHRIEYANFTFKGKQPFEGVKGATAAYIIGIKPGIQLESLPDCYTIQGKHNG
jgi:hypothetical protein